MDFLTNIHLGAVIATMIRELGSWSWENPFCIAMFAFFMVGFVPQFLLLRMKWKPWTISVILGALVIVCDFVCLMTGGFVFELLTLLEMFFLAALLGAAGGGAVHIFWELFRKRKPGEEDNRWNKWQV